jgi:hypothetical protein
VKTKGGQWGCAVRYMTCVAQMNHQRAFARAAKTPRIRAPRTDESPEKSPILDLRLTYLTTHRSILCSSNNHRREVSSMRPRCTVLVIALASTILALAAPPAGAVPPGTFGRMFGDLPGLTSPTNADLVALAGSMQEVVAQGQPDNNTTFVQGQFLDHDMTLDLEPSPIAPVNIKTLDNTRNARLDLDSVYGDGPGGTPQLYEADKKHLRVGVSAGTIPDVPRNDGGTAILGDGRNDENLVIAQFHAAFLRFHNRLIDEGCRSRRPGARRSGRGNG